MKIAGRDAGRIGVILEDLGNNYFIIDGDTRKKKTNIKHIEFLGKELKLGKNPTSEDLRKAINELGLKTHKHGQPKQKKQEAAVKKETQTKEEQKKKPEKKTKK